MPAGDLGDGVSEEIRVHHDPTMLHRQRCESVGDEDAVQDRVGAIGDGAAAVLVFRRDLASAPSGAGVVDDEVAGDGEQPRASSVGVAFEDLRALPGPTIVSCTTSSVSAAFRVRFCTNRRNAGP